MTSLTEPAQTEIVNVRRRQDRSAQTRQKIIEAAAVEFATKGFGGTTTRSIAERAEVRHGLVIYHFETKQGVWQTVIDQVILRWHVELMNAIEPLAHSDPAGALRAFQRTFIELSANEPESHWLMSQDARDPLRQLSPVAEGLTAKDFALFKDLITRAQAAGRYIEGDPMHLHYLFVGAAARVFMMSGEVERNLGQSPFDKSFIEQHIAYCAKLFFR